MAVEIKQIVIKAVLTENEESRSNHSGDNTANNDQQLLVQECVDQVLKILKKKNSR